MMGICGIGRELERNRGREEYRKDGGDIERNIGRETEVDK